MLPEKRCIFRVDKLFILSAKAQKKGVKKYLFKVVDKLIFAFLYGRYFSINLSVTSRVYSFYHLLAPLKSLQQMPTAWILHSVSTFMCGNLLMMDFVSSVCSVCLRSATYQQETRQTECSPAPSEFLAPTSKQTNSVPVCVRSRLRSWNCAPHRIFPISIRAVGKKVTASMRRQTSEHIATEQSFHLCRHTDVAGHNDVWRWYYASLHADVERWRANASEWRKHRRPSAIACSTSVVGCSSSSSSPPVSD